MRWKGWFLAALAFAGCLNVQAQFDPSKVCRLEEGKLIIALNKSWTHAQKLEVAQLFDLDTALVLNVYDGKKEITAGGATWSIRELSNDRFEIFKPLVAPISPTNTGNVIVLDDRWINAEGINKRESETFGVNRFTLFNVFNYRNGTATFYLPRHLEAGQVFLSGTFNNWATRRTPMTKTDSGWIVSVKMSPGKYAYKYILDGKWMEDPYNKLKEYDKNGGNNSVVFCYNYRFSLAGYPDAKKVYVAGSFNGWNGRQLQMIKVNGGWVLHVFLHEGTHAYKFVVDGNWILDPAAKVNRPDGGGNLNSFLAIGDTFYFHLKDHLSKSKIAVAGNFNGWNPNETFLTRTEDGWEIPYVLAPGNYEYKFIADGNWMTDPANPVTVRSGGETNSYLTIKPNYTFVLEGYPDAKKVIVTGNFSGWSYDNYPMTHRDNRWVLSLHLPPGKCTYRFIVDGKWMEDPANDQWETNEYGSKNSVLWLEK